MTNANTRPRIWPIALVVVTLLALGLRWYYVSTAMVMNPIRGDATQYYSYAWNLVHHGIFAGNLPGSPTQVADSFRDPGYPLLLAFWMAWFGTGELWYAAVLLCQALLGALTVTFAMQVGRRWLPWGWAAGAGVLMAVWPHSITIASDLLSETLFAFLCALAMLLCARACDRRSPRWAAAAGIAFGAAALTNAVLLPFGVLLALYLAWRRRVPRSVWMALALGALILPGAWAVRNMQLPEQSAAASSRGRALLNLVQGSWPIYHDAYMAMIHGDPRGRQILDRIDSEYRLLASSPRQGASAIAQRLARDPLHYLAWYALEKPRLLWGWRIRMGQNDIYVYPAKNSPFDTQAFMRALVSVCHAINPLLAALALACLPVAALRRRRGKGQADDGDTMLQAVIVLLVFVTLVYGVLQSEPRYSIPFRAFEMLLSITSARWLVQWVQRLRTGAATGSDNTLLPPDTPAPRSVVSRQNTRTADDVTLAGHRME